MKREKAMRHFVWVFVAALGLYAATYALLEHLRNRKGGWQVTFMCATAGEPSVSVSQPWLNIANLTLVFPDHRCQNASFTNTILFDRPIKTIPFGRVVYLDTTFLPGSVVLDLFGQQIELLPRVLVVNGREFPWQPEAILELR
jgi:hypothetical protein